MTPRHPAPRRRVMAVVRLLAVAIVPAVLAACSDGGREPEAPALVVIVTVDQLRGDLLERYQPALEGGFARIMSEGLVYTGASHNHSSTFTAVGHTTLGTGLYPVNHGIIENSWYERMTDGSLRAVYAVEDSLSPILGYPTAGGRSPANIRADGFGDWVIAADTAARVLSISTKDRGAIPMAGQSRTHEVYWWMPQDGRYVTSEYYTDDYPNWVQRFNRERIPQLMADTIWANPVPEAQQSLARRDDAPYESDGEHVTFPHLRSVEAGRSAAAGNLWRRSTPFIDRATLEMALDGMRELQLGQRGATDYLSVSFSATDYVGHSYGPLSQEQLANLDHLDGLLAELLTALDAQVGEENWTLALSADHGVLTTPEYLVELGEPGYRTSGEDGALLDSVVAAAAAAAEAEGLEGLELRRRVAEAAETVFFVEDVMVPEDELLQGEPADSFVALFQKSYTPGRMQGIPEYDLPMRTTEGSLISPYSLGSSHGSPYWYDRWVPIVFMGSGVRAGRSSEAVYTVDVAPTLAALAGLTAPSGLDGRVLEVGR